MLPSCHSEFDQTLKECKLIIKEETMKNIFLDKKNFWQSITNKLLPCWIKKWNILTVGNKVNLYLAGKNEKIKNKWKT